MKQKLHYKLLISGRVQGVGFRHKTRSTARYLGIFGIVKNLADGSVYIEAEAEKEVLEIFLNWCRKGPDYSMVEKVIKTEGPLKGYSSFEILY